MLEHLTIYIPTYKRAASVSTLKYICRSMDAKVHLVVRSEEAKEYFCAYPHVQLLVLPGEVQNLSQTRQFILNHCTTRFCMMLDDDLAFYYRPNRGDWHLKYATAEMFVPMVREMLEHMDQNDIAHCAVSAREGANRHLSNWSENQRYMRAYIFDTHVVRGFTYSNACCGCEDFAMNLDLLTSGHKSGIFYAYSQGQASSNDEGGLSTYRTREYHTKAMEALQARHPKYVRLVEKKTKTAWGWGTRIDAIIAWKKAYNDSPKIIGASCPPASTLNPQ